MAGPRPRPICLISDRSCPDRDRRSQTTSLIGGWPSEILRLSTVVVTLTFYCWTYRSISRVNLCCRTCGCRGCTRDWSDSEYYTWTWRTTRTYDCMRTVLLSTGITSHSRCLPTHTHIVDIHHVSKNTCQLIFCSVSVKYEQISVKLVSMSGNKHLTKLYIKCPLHLKYVLALPWEIWSVRSSRQRNNYMYTLISLIIFTSYAWNVCLQRGRQYVDAGATRQQHISSIWWKHDVTYYVWWFFERQ